MESAVQAIAVDGVSGASVERITRGAGVSRGLLRHHYGSKGQLLAEAFQLLADDYRRMLGVGDAAASSDRRAPGQRLRDAIVQAFEEIKDVRDRQYAWFGFWALARSDAEIARINRELYEDVIDHLGGLVASVARERHRDVDSVAAGRGLAAMIEGTWLHSVIGVEGVSTVEAERLCLDYAARLLSLDSL